jgi:hypothetical protein
VVHSGRASSAGGHASFWPTLKETPRPIDGRFARLAAGVLFLGLFSAVALALLWLMFN